MDIEDLSFDEVLQGLLGPRGSRDPRARRLAAVTSALLDVATQAQATTMVGGSSSSSAAQLYVQGMATLEGTLLRSPGDTAAEVNESLGTQVALLQVLSATIPHVEPTQIVVATLAVASRVLKSIVSFCQSVDATALDTEDELGGVSAVLRGAAKTCGQLAVELQGTQPDSKTLQQFWKGTVLALIADPRPKVRKSACHAAVQVLTGTADGKCHPLLRHTTIAFLGTTLAQARKRVEGKGASDITEVLPMLAFAERAIPHLLKKDDDEKTLTAVMELFAALVRVETETITGANATTDTTDFVAIAKQKSCTDGGGPTLVINALLGVLRNVLESESEQSDASPTSSQKLGQFASRVVASLLTAQPMWVFCSGMNNASTLRQGRTLWGQVLLAGSRRILDNDNSPKDVAQKILPLVVKMVLLLAKPVDEEDEEEASVAFQLFVDLTQLFREYMPALQGIGGTALLHEITVSLEQVFQPAYRPTWAVSLKCFVICLQYSEDESYASEKLEILIRERNAPTSSKAAKNSIEDALSTLLQAAGLEKVWSWTQWPNGLGTARERGWIITIMKSASHLAQPFPLELAFFQDEVLALARRFDRVVSTGPPKYKLENRLGVIETWKLLPCVFEQLPPDVTERLSTLTTTMTKALEDTRYPELTPVICQSLSQLAKCGEENLELHAEVLESASASLLPVLFKISMSLAQESSAEADQMETETEAADDSQGGAKTEKGQQLHVLGEAICSLCRIVNRSFLQGLFKKLMHRLLEEIQLETPSEEKLCAYFALSQSLVKSGVLQENSIAFLFRAMKPALRDGNHGPRSTKRAYKLLAEICEQHSSFFSESTRLEELSSLLNETAGSSQVAARYMRLKCISRVVEGLETTAMAPAVLDKILAVMSEVLLCLKDSNGKTRNAAYELLLAISTKNDYNTMLRLLTAGLAAETPHMRSATVMALSRVVYEFVGEKEEVQASLEPLLRTVLCLLAEDSREVIGSVVSFVRVCVSAIPKEQLEPLLPELIGSLLKYHKVKDRFRTKVKVILKKLVKRFGYDGLMQHVPKSEARLLTHMRKVDERMKRKKTARQIADTSTKAGFDDLVDSDEEDSDNGRTLVTTVAGDALTKASRKSKRSRGQSTAEGSRARTSTVQLPSEADGNIVDMLGSNMAKKVSFFDEAHGNSDDSSEDDDDVVEFNDDGLLVVREAPADAEEAPGDSGRKKRKLSRFESASAGKPVSGRKGSKRSGDLGRAYKSKKAGGDVKRKDQKYEPYAFVPLNAKAYSKKHRKNAVESMSSVVRRGKKQKQFIKTS